MASAGLRLNCAADRTVADTTFASRFASAHSLLKEASAWGLGALPSEQNAAAQGLKGVGVGEISGLAVDEAGGTLYVFHRGPNRFDGSAPIPGAAILAPPYLAFQLPKSDWH